jgi:hypothetical protein
MRLCILLSFVAMQLAASQCYAQLELFTNQSGWTADARSIYVFHSEIGQDPAFGELTGPINARSAGLPPDPNILGASHNLSADQTALYGPGLRVSLLNQNCDGWYCGAIYEGIFIDGYMQAGVQSDSFLVDDRDNIHANLVNRTLADNNALNDDFDSGLVDFASERVELDKQAIDLVFGRKLTVTRQATAFWKFGLRGTWTGVKRNVYYYNLERIVDGGGFAADADTANIDFSSKMLGLGPVFGSGGTWRFGDILSLSGDISLAAVYGDFTLKRNERNYNESLDRVAYSNIKVDSSGFVPMMDCSLELSARLSRRCTCAVGYTVAASLGGARSISIPGWDDIDEETAPYTIKRDDIVSHGIYLRVCYLFGS